ncbi:MAG: zeta toxin family protein [Pyrinomonadaceae bacterium]|nr:zeta toxin family protein [Pyrinomonadaceae bacterium]
MKSESKKSLIIVAGGNGVGKTTFAKQFLLENEDYIFLNADEIAKETNSSKISAGKIFFERLNKAINKEKALLIESTLSGRYLIRFIEVLREKNYEVVIIFLFADSPEILIERIKIRVQKGGHFVPNEDVKRRFKRGKANFWTIYKNLADSWSLVYNSEGRFFETAIAEDSEINIVDDNLFQKFLSI